MKYLLTLLCLFSAHSFTIPDSRKYILVRIISYPNEPDRELSVYTKVYKTLSECDKMLEANVNFALRVGHTIDMYKWKKDEEGRKLIETIDKQNRWHQTMKCIATNEINKIR